jgi:hypothetical protein
VPELHQERPPASARGDVRKAGAAGAGHHKGSGPRPAGPVFRPLRIMPLQVAYVWRARTYPWAIRALAAAEAVYGKPAANRTVGRPRKTAPEASPGQLPQSRCPSCHYLMGSAGHLTTCGETSCA